MPPDGKRRSFRQRFSAKLAAVGLSVFRVSSGSVRGRACACLAERSDATCIKTEKHFYGDCFVMTVYHLQNSAFSRAFCITAKTISQGE